ncbi:MAG: ABC transporter ATP-binding protein [Clostridiales bacterium]|nr:ABC transporter ATP-binding protein [Clostridiales bacterium]
MGEYLLEIDDLCKKFRLGSMLFGKTIKAVDGVTIRLPKDEPWILSIVGESGSGKTTLARMVLGLLEKSSGEIKIDGRTLKEFDKREFYKFIQPIFQNPFSSFSSMKKVDTYLYETAKNIAGCKTTEEAERRITEVLESVGIDFEMVKGKYPNQFSGGELQRISIARALIPQPAIIVADEPVAMIDASLRMNVVNIFKKLKEEMGVSFIYITHDLSTAYYVSDYIAAMYKGNLIEYGTGKQVLEEPLHPYTELLLDSIPKIGQKWEKRSGGKAAVDVDYSNADCRFAARCPYAEGRCRECVPDFYEVDAGHRVLCHRYAKQ